MTSRDARFADLYERHYRDIYAYCRRRTAADRVEDAVADTFLVAWRKIGEVPTADEALPWLYAVAYRALGHQWRGASRQARLRKKLNTVGELPVSPPEDYVLMSEESRWAMQALRRLKPADQELLRLAVWEELRHQQIAEVLGLSLDAVKKRYSRARKQLTRQLNLMESRNATPPAAQKGGAR